jgi:hypothetical protein
MVINDEIINSFAGMQNKNETTEILKELFDRSKISMINDLSSDEIKLITRIKMISELKNLKVWDKGIEFYLNLKLSHKRKSRREIIDAIKGYQPKEGIFNKFNPLSR